MESCGFLSLEMSLGDRLWVGDTCFEWGERKGDLAAFLIYPAAGFATYHDADAHALRSDGECDAKILGRSECLPATYAAELRCGERLWLDEAVVFELAGLFAFRCKVLIRAPRRVNVGRESAMHADRSGRDVAFRPEDAAGPKGRKVGEWW